MLRSYGTQWEVKPKLTLASSQNHENLSFVLFPAAVKAKQKVTFAHKSVLPQVAERLSFNFILGKITSTFGYIAQKTFFFLESTEWSLWK